MYWLKRGLTTPGLVPRGAPHLVAVDVRLPKLLDPGFESVKLQLKFQDESGTRPNQPEFLGQLFPQILLRD